MPWVGLVEAGHGMVLSGYFQALQGLLLLLTFPRKLIIVLEHPCKFTQFSCMLCEGKRWVQINTWVQLQSREESWPASQSRQEPSPNGDFWIFERVTMPKRKVMDFDPIIMVQYL